jgi:hypothetical protein
MIRAAAFAVAGALVSPLVMAPRAQLDHLVVAIRNLDEGIAQFETMTGVKAAVGGRHPGRGTENALVALGGGSYMEILAPQKGGTLLPEDEPIRGLARLTIMDWAVSIPVVDEAIAALQTVGFKTSPLQPGSRLTPAGERLEWSTFGLSGARIDVAPFFIHWSANTRHPSTTAPGGCSLERVLVQDPESARLSAALKALEVSGVTVQFGAPRIDATLTCGSKRATLTSR